ncbi:MAG: hypothetical protein HKN41_09755 [Ilumatobacter sp.]|nr:hypothetical protein [Ilumatobacter sp.]
MFTDSVGLGAKDALPRAFPADWQVRVDGTPAEMVGEMEHNFVRPRLATNPEWFGDHVVIAAGYNFPYWNHDRFVREVDSMIETLTAAGVKHVYWMTLREVKPQYISASAWRQIQPYSWYFPDVNVLLEQALERHPNLSLVEWRHVADQSGITYDAIHLNPTGAALFSSIIRQMVDQASTRVPDGSTTRIHVPDGETAAAAAVNITTTSPRTAGFITTHPCGEVPLVSMHNYVREQVVAHSTIVALDDQGDFCVTTSRATNLIVDVTGVFEPGLGFTATTPTRWLDTRERPGRAPLADGDVLELDIDDVRTDAGVSGAPSAVAVSITAAEAAGPGWLRATTCGSTADTSNVNFLDASPVPNFAIVELDAEGRICIEARTDTQVIVDLFGVFDDEAPVRASPAVRLYDSRDEGVRVAAQSTTRLAVADAGIAADVSAVAVNLTAVEPAAVGHLTVYPCDAGLPLASSLNVTAFLISNAAIVAPDAAGEICVFSHSETHLIVDVQGDLGAVFSGRTPQRLLDTRG